MLNSRLVIFDKEIGDLFFTSSPALAIFTRHFGAYYNIDDKMMIA